MAVVSRLTWPTSLDPAWVLTPVYVDLLGQLVFGKRGEGAAEGGFAGRLTGAVPAAALPQPGAGLEGVQERAGGGELDRRAGP